MITTGRTERNGFDAARGHTRAVCLTPRAATASIACSASRSGSRRMLWVNTGFHVGDVARCRGPGGCDTARRSRPSRKHRDRPGRPDRARAVAARVGLDHGRPLRGSYRCCTCTPAQHDLRPARCARHRRVRGPRKRTLFLGRIPPRSAFFRRSARCRSDRRSLPHPSAATRLTRSRATHRQRRSRPERIGDIRRP